VRRPGFPLSAAEPRTATIRIDRIGAEGDGIGHLADRDAREVFVPRTLPGELVLARLAGKRGEAEAITDPSAERVDPPCPHFGACGGCALQHWRRDAYRDWKSAQVAAALRRAGFADVPMRPIHPAEPGQRRRLDLAIRRQGAAVVVGLHQLRSAAIVDLDLCPVAHPALQALIAPLRRLFAHTSMLRREGSAMINLLDSGPDLLMRTDAEPGATDRAALARFAAAHGVPRISWARASGEPEPVCQLRPASTAFGGIPVSPSPGAFLQATAEGEHAIREAVLTGLPDRIAPRATIVELYAGSGTLTFPLAQRARVLAVEGDAAAHDALRDAAARAGLTGRIRALHRDLARQPLSAKEFAGAAAIVLDPPHAGAAAQMPAIAAARAERVIYVSCNPAALARDARVLRDGGYTLVAATPVDQFLWSARIEAVCVFARGTPAQT
jgi:23S rRNA (uracil1939-C5)-methyltransferase